MPADHKNADADTPQRGVRVHASLPGRDRRSRLATAISFAVHALLIYLAVRLTAAVVLPTHSTVGDAIELVLSGGGGGGGQNGVAFNHSTPPPAPVPPPVIPPPPPPVPKVIPPPAPVPQQIAPPAPVPAPADQNGAAAGTGSGTGGGNGTGVGTGTGSGEGPGSGSGKGGGDGGGNRGIPPEPRQMTLPPFDNTPKQLRRRPIDVTFTVSAEGQVSDLVIAPPIENKDFSRRFDDIMRKYRFKPARDATGKAVADTVTITFTLP